MTATPRLPQPATGTTPGLTPVDSEATRSVGTSPATDAGSAEGTARPGLPADATAAIAPPALPGQAEGGAAGAGAGRVGGAATAPADAGVAGRIEDAGVRPPLPVLELVRDPVIVEMWQRYGSPQRGRSLAERFSANRPGPWGWWPAYLLLAFAFGAGTWNALLGIARLPSDTAREEPAQLRKEPSGADADLDD